MLKTLIKLGVPETAEKEFILTFEPDVVNAIVGKRT
jgi:hypothetical protein